MRDGDLVRKVVQEIGVAREGLLHIVQHLGELVGMRVEVFQRIHHHAGAVVIVLIVFRVDLVVGHREIAAHRLLIRPEIADAVEHGDGQLVVGLDEAEIVAAVERRAALGEDGVAGDLALVLQLIIIKVERELERTGGGEHRGLVPVVFLAGDGIVIGDGEVRLVEVIFRAERVEAGGKRIRFIRRKDGRSEQQHSKQRGDELFHGIPPDFAVLRSIAQNRRNCKRTDGRGAAYSVDSKEKPTQCNRSDDMSPCNNYTTTGQSCGCETPQAPCQGGCPGAAPCPPPQPCIPICPFPPFPPMPPRPRPPQVEPADIDCGCDCAAGMSAMLQLLCDPRIAPLVDYSQFAFFTRNFVLGTSLDCPATSTAGYDNLTGPLAGSFERIRSCSCENLEVSGQIYYPIPICTGGTETPCCAEGPAFDAGEVPLCALTAVAFTIPAAEGETTPTDYDQLKGLLWQALHPGRPGASGSTPPMKPTPCDCDETVAGRKTVSLTAGPLLVGNAAVLGSVGNVLVLANDTSRRIYFVCKDQIGFLS